MSINDLRQKLKSNDPEEKVGAVKELVALKSREAGKILVEALREETDENTRELLKKGINYLKKFFSDQITEPSPNNKSTQLSDAILDKVKIALTSSNSSEEKKAVRFIMQNGVRELIPFLIESSVNRNNIELMLASVKIIESMNASEHADDLFDLFKHQDSRLVKASIKAAVSIDVIEQSFSILEGLCEDEREDVAQEAIRAMKVLSEKNLKEAQELLEKLDNAEKEPTLFVPEGMDDLLPQLKTDVEQDKLAEEKKKRSVATQLYKFKEDLESNDPAKREMAIKKIVDARDPEAVELITQILTKEEDVHVIATGVSSLSKLGSESALPSIQSYLDHDDARVRANAVDSIAKLLAPDAPKPMLERMLQDPNHRVRANTILAIFTSKPNECFLALNSLAQSMDVAEQMSALYCFEALQEDTHLGLLQRFFVGPEGKTREKTRQILENWTGDKTVVGFILNESPEKFHELFRNHLEKKRSKMVSTEPASPSSNNPDSENLDTLQSADEAGSIVIEEADNPNVKQTLFERLMNWLGLRKNRRSED